MYNKNAANKEAVPANPRRGTFLDLLRSAPKDHEAARLRCWSDHDERVGAGSKRTPRPWSLLCQRSEIRNQVSIISAELLIPDF
jgi:hypothetical protein